MKTPEIERKAFEHWADARCYYLDKRDDGHYEKSSTALAWEIAQYFMAIGRGQGVELEGCVVVPVEPTKAMIDAMEQFDDRNDYADMTSAYKAALEAARGGNE